MAIAPADNQDKWFSLLPPDGKREGKSTAAEEEEGHMALTTAGRRERAAGKITFDGRDQVGFFFPSFLSDPRIRNSRLEMTVPSRWSLSNEKNVLMS